MTTPTEKATAEKSISIQDITAMTNKLIETNAKFAAFFSRAELEYAVAMGLAETRAARLQGELKREPWEDEVAAKLLPLPPSGEEQK